MQRPVAIAAAILVVAVALLLWMWFGTAQEPAPSEPLPAPAEAAPALESVPDGSMPVALPALEDSDDLVGDELVSLGVPRPLIGLVETEQMVRALVAATDAVAVGRSPRGQLGFLEPDGYFDVAERGDTLVIAIDTFRRYDAVGAAIDGLDVERVVDSYLRLEPLADAAYSELGMPGPFRTRLLAALEHLIAAPLIPDPVAVLDAINRYRFADPELEALSGAQKHLLRTGPQNQEKIQAQMRRLRDALLAAQ
jgi:PAS domain-containing protein